MSLTIRSTMNNQAAAQGLNDAGKSAENTGESKNRKTINASELNLKPYKDNQIDAKRLRARKQAMKLISDAWKYADKTDKNIDDMKLDKLNKLDEITELKKKVSDLENEKEAYRVDYGVDKDSQEQKDLELLEKYQNNRYGSAEDPFSKEELERLKELQNTPLTEYQEKVLKLNSSQIHFKDEIGQKELKIACTTASIALAEIDRDKSQEMLKAQDSADQIIGAVEGEVKNLLVNEGKDNIDDKVEENKEKADEAEKKQEEQQEKIDEKRKERKEQEEKMSPEILEMIRTGDEYIRTIREANDDIPGEVISEKLDRLEQVVRRIFESVKKHPEQKKEMDKFMDYYMPTTLKLVNAYREFDALEVKGENITNAMQEIENTLDTISLAFEKLLDDLFQDAAFDVSTDISVLQMMLAREGYKEKDFK